MNNLTTFSEKDFPVIHHFHWKPGDTLIQVGASLAPLLIEVRVAIEGRQKGKKRKSQVVSLSFGISYFPS